MRFATSVMIFGQDKWVMRNLENAYPHVDQIYVMYPHIPWNTYNPNAQKLYPSNTFDLNIIKESKYADKVTIIEGEWPNETVQRNVCINRAVQDGVDYLMIHDVDEFYFHEDFEKLKKRIKQFSHIDMFMIKAIIFWKSFKHVLIASSRYDDCGYLLGGNISGAYEIIINLHNNIRFIDRRITNSRIYLVIDDRDIVMYHASYMLTNEEMLKKLKTWGHGHLFDVDKWYNEKWLNYTTETTNLDPIYPETIIGTELYDGKLPEVIADLRDYNPNS